MARGRSSFDQAFLGRAFERFSRPDGSRRDGGSGLGLSIVDAIARAHRGEAHVDNEEGGGADAWLVLPAARSGDRSGAPR
jgi:signal transduction histidine kinase